MHIPDGYLSPSTCACLYGGCAPFWYSSLKRVQSTMRSRTVPLLSLFAAFSFVLMMFNLPLPGGTTGHAVGVGIAAVVLGPAASIIAISMALLIQALFFGDGGVTTFGANCFNMAVVGSLVASAVYRITAWKSELTSGRRAVAAGIGGYVAINAAAFCAAVEFGIQPLLFHDAAGAPLYAPYPLHIAIPAMMIGHLTIAGCAEFVVAAGLTRYLQRTDVTLLSDARFAADSSPSASRKRSLRGLSATLAALLLITPLGIIAIGSAWGEWKATDFEDTATRRQIAAASRNQPLPGRIPEGLRKLSDLWKAPVADYSPAFVHSRPVGYVVSAMVGVGTVALFTWFLGRLWWRSRRSVVERTLERLLDTTERALFAEQSWRKPGFLQRLDPRVKVGGFAALVIAAAASGKLVVLVATLALSTLAALLSGVSFYPLLTRLWLGVLAFTGLIALPAVFLTSGHVVAEWPAIHLSMTAEGLRGAMFLILRAETVSTLCGLLILTTPWSDLLRALRFLHVPATVVASAGITYRYVFVFVQSGRGMLEARQARSVGKVRSSEQRRLAALSAGALLDKVFQMSTEVHTAMVARGYRGEVHVLDDFQMRRADWMQLSVLLAVAGLLAWWGW